MTHRILLIGSQLFLAACTAARAPEPAAPAAGEAIAITHVDVVPMTEDTLLRDMTVIVQGERIAAVERADRARVPAGARVIDGRGRFLLPGLVDAHVHLTNRMDVDTLMAAVMLAKGVTSAIDLGGSGLPGDSMRLRLRAGINAGRRPGPTLYMARTQVNDSALTREGGMRRVDEDHAAGWDLMKVYNRLSVDGYRGIMLRAHQLGMPVVGHVVRPAGLEGTIGSGQRGIVHFEEYHQYFGFRSTDTLQVPEQTLFPEAIPYFARITAEAGTYVTPTLAIYAAMIAQGEDQVEIRPGSFAEAPPAPHRAIRDRNAATRCPTTECILSRRHAERHCKSFACNALIGAARNPYIEHALCAPMVHRSTGRVDDALAAPTSGRPAPRHGRVRIGGNTAVRRLQ